MSAARILIASPTYDGAVRVEFMRAIMLLTAAFRQAGVGCELVMEQATQLHVMRSVMASRALRDGFSHVLFVDTDMGFAPSAVLRMLAADKPVIGCAYPYRSLPLHVPVTAQGATLRQVVGENVPYAVWFPEGTTTFEVVEGLCEVEAIGAGLLLVRCDALAAMAENGVARAYRTSFPYSQWYAHAEYHGFFEHRLHEGAYLGEDLSFCRAWRESGGTIHALCDEEVMHVGAVPVVGRYFDRLLTGKL